MADTISTNTTTSTPSYVTDQSAIDNINSIYDKNLASQKIDLQNTYNNNMSEAQANKNKIADSYNTQKNDLSNTYEINKRNANIQANANGLNAGTASQMQLSLNNAQAKNMASIAKAQADAETESNRTIFNLQQNYQSDIAKAAADNDYQRAAALKDEYDNQYNKALDMAQTLANSGDFSGYKVLGGAYTDDAINNMQKSWALQNPAEAYARGLITADEYFSVTGSYPPGYAVPSYGGGGEGSYYSNPTQKAYTNLEILEALSDGGVTNDRNPTTMTVQSVRNQIANNNAMSASQKTAANNYVNTIINSRKSR